MQFKQLSFGHKTHMDSWSKISTTCGNFKGKVNYYCVICKEKDFQFNATTDSECNSGIYGDSLWILGLLRSNAFYIHTLISGIIAYKITNPGKHVNCCVKKSATINHKILTNYIHALFLWYLQQDCMQLVRTTLHKHVTLSRSHVVYRLCNHF